MPLFSAHQAKSQNDQPQTTAAAEKPAFQTESENQPKTKKQYTTPMQVIFATHTNTPCIFYAGGVGNLTA